MALSSAYDYDIHDAVLLLFTPTPLSRRHESVISPVETQSSYPTVVEPMTNNSGTPTRHLVQDRVSFQCADNSEFLRQIYVVASEDQEPLDRDSLLPN